jgi:hypothetical protein
VALLVAAATACPGCCPGRSPPAVCLPRSLACPALLLPASGRSPSVLPWLRAAGTAAGTASGHPYYGRHCLGLPPLRASMIMLFLLVST